MKRAVALAMLVLAGCALVEPLEPTSPAPMVDALEPRQVAELLGYYQHVAGLGPEDQKRELATATQAFSDERSNENRVRLALVYSIPGTALQDDARASQLLEPIASGSGALHQFAVLVHGQVTDRLKAQKRADQLKDQIEQLRAIEKQLKDQIEQQRAIEKQLIERGQRADQLKEQVEQLRAIEKQLIERGSQAPPPRKP